MEGRGQMPNIICDKCKHTCRQTPIGRCVILNREGIILRMSCYTCRVQYNKLLIENKSILKYLKKRSM